MTHLKIAYTEKALELFGAVCGRETVDIESTDFTDVAAVVLTDRDADALKTHKKIGAFDIPVFLIRTGSENVSDEVIGKVFRVIDLKETDHALFERQIISAADNYEANILPPFFKDLKKYVENGYAQFDCPGHQGGAFYRKHPAGRAFMISSVKTHLEPTSATQTLLWETCSFMKVLLVQLRNTLQLYTTQTRLTSY